MEKTEFVVNFLREFIIGSELEAIKAQLFRVLHKTCEDTNKLIPEQEKTISKELPSSGQELEQFLALVEELSKNHSTFVSSLSKVELEEHQKLPDLSLTKSDELMDHKKPQIIALEESFSNLK